MSALLTNILQLEKLLLLDDRVLEEMAAPFSFPENCCPFCACGRPYADLVEKQERRAWVLARLLVKRGRRTRALRDFRRAETLFYDYGTQNADWVRWRAEQSARFLIGFLASAN